MAVQAAAVRQNYPKLASFLDQYPGVLSLRRFRTLSIQNLLYYQAEIAHLEEELLEIETLDTTPSKRQSELATFRWKPVEQVRATYCCSHSTVGQSPKTGANSPPRSLNTVVQVTSVDLYREKFLQVRATLEKYNEALDQYLKIDRLSNPSPNDLRNLRHWLDAPEYGNGFLEKSPEHVWHAGNTLSPDEFLTATTQIGMTSAISRIFVHLRRLFSWRRSQPRIYSVSGTDDGVIARTASVVIASVLPVLPIIILFFVDRLLTRLGLILLFTAVFAIVLVFGLKMQPDQALAVTTAIAAIQVVYVGSTANSGDGTTGSSAGNSTSNGTSS